MLGQDFTKILEDIYYLNSLNDQKVKDASKRLNDIDDFLRFGKPTLEGHLADRNNPHLVRGSQLQPEQNGDFVLGRDYLFYYDYANDQFTFYLPQAAQTMVEFSPTASKINPYGYDADFIVSGVNSDLLTVDAAGEFTALGVDDQYNGVLYLYGDATGSYTGGTIRFYSAADHDTNVQYVQLQQYGNQFKITNDYNTVIAQLIDFVGLFQYFNYGGDTFGTVIRGGGDDWLVFVDAVQDFVGIGTNDPDSKLHILNGSAGTVSAGANAVLTVENNGAMEIQFLAPNTNTISINFGDPDDIDIGIIAYNHGNDSFIMTAGTQEVLRMNTGDIYFNRQNNDTDFRVSTVNDNFTLFVNAGTDSVGIWTNAPSSVLHVAHASSGVLVGASPTGGDKGAGTINVSGNVYKNNTAYTNPDYVLEHWVTGEIKKFANRPRAKDFVPMTVREIEGYILEHYRLPGITDEPAGVFDMTDIALELLERLFTITIEQQDQIDNLRRLIQ